MLNIGDFVTAKPQFKKNLGKSFSGVVFNLSILKHAYVLEPNTGDVIFYHLDELQKIENFSEESLQILERWLIHEGDLVCSTPHYERLYQGTILGLVQRIQPDNQAVILSETKLIKANLFHLKKLYNVRPMIESISEQYERKIKLLNQIDECLDNGNQKDFYLLANEWKVAIESGSNFERNFNG